MGGVTNTIDARRRNGSKQADLAGVGGINKFLAEVFVCPLKKSPLRYCEETETLISDQIGVSFPSSKHCDGGPSHSSRVYTREGNQRPSMARCGRRDYVRATQILSTVTRLHLWETLLIEQISNPKNDTIENQNCLEK
ncbi:hypothetical protein AKJ16_DCAP04086 [Drosera capensis]